MSDSLPFMNSTGLITKILNKIIEAQTPQKYNQDFQANKLGYGSGSAKPFIPLLKRIGFIGSDGTPTEIYKRFRNSSSRGSAMASAIKNGYGPLYSISEYAHDLEPAKLKDAVIQVTGQENGSSTVKGIVGTFNALKSFASFDNNEEEEASLKSDETNYREDINILPSSNKAPEQLHQTRGMNLSYTINLNLPETKDPEVFDAIFSSLKSKLLS